MECKYCGQILMDGAECDCPEATRERIYGDIMLLSDKRALDGVKKKHGNIPL